MVPRQGNAMAEIPASLTASTWSLIILRNGDATTIPRSLLSKDNYGQHGQDKLVVLIHPEDPIPSSQVGGALLQSTLLFYANYNSKRRLATSLSLGERSEPL